MGCILFIANTIAIIPKFHEKILFFTCIGPITDHGFAVLCVLYSRNIYDGKYAWFLSFIDEITRITIQLLDIKLYIL